MIDTKSVFDVLSAKVRASAPEIARHLMGGAAKTTKSDIAKTRETLKWLVADGLVTLSEIDSKRGQLFVIATTKTDNSACDDGENAGKDIDALATDAIAFVIDVAAGGKAEKNDAETAPDGGDTLDGLKAYAEGILFSYAVQVTASILAADPKTDKIWAADRALDAVRHIARRIEKEGAK